MVNVFTREITDDLAGLVKQIDTFVADNEDAKIAAFLVLLSEDPDADEKKLQEFAEKHGIKNVPLTIFDGIAGPPKYKVAKEAAVTVMMWRKTTVESNHAFATLEELDRDAVQSLLKDTEKILE